MRDALDGLLDAERVERLASRLAIPTGEVERQIVALSVESRLLLPIMREIPRFAAARSLPGAESVRASLESRDGDVRRAFARVRRVAELSERHLIEANLRLVVS